MKRDSLRSARLLFDRELSAGAVSEGDLEDPAVAHATTVRRVPPKPLRVLQRLAMRRGRLDWVNGSARPMAQARAAVLDERAAGPPRLLVRVDEFPHAQAVDRPERYGRERFERFHSVLANAGVPYLLAVVPRASRDYLNPELDESRPLADDELELLRRLPGEGVSYALHGYDHRTKHPHPRRHSELAGLDRAATGALLDRAGAALAEAGVEPRVFVPPFNRFSAEQYEVLAERFDVVCGGPETVMSMGFQRTPLWRGDAVYLPSYQPLYAPAGDLAGPLAELERLEWALWTPVTLHWGWEEERGYEGLERLAPKLASMAVHWDEFLAATRRSADMAAVP
jgi:hypothetical protein